MSLEALRAQLDAADDALLEALARRAEAVRAIWEWKAAHGMERFDLGREAAVRARLKKEALARGLSPDAVERIFERIIGQRLQR